MFEQSVLLKNFCAIQIKMAILVINGKNHAHFLIEVVQSELKFKYIMTKALKNINNEDYAFYMNMNAKPIKSIIISGIKEPLFFRI